MPLTPGTKLGRYEIISALGRGGMGEVYRAHDTSLNRTVAIKVLPESLSEDESRLARLSREAESLAALNSPFVASIYDVGEDDGKRFIVMELVEGETLAQRIRRSPLSAERALDVFAQIAEGIEAAHEKGLVHRDLKPANIMIAEDKSVKILDFGLAAAISESAAIALPDEETSPGLPPSSTLTTDGAVMGTPSYMSPEQAQGKPVDKRTDIWAFGCCFVEALTGHRPFTGSDAHDILNSILSSPPDMSDLPSDLPAGVVRLLERCLEKDPRNRWRDIGDARIELTSEQGHTLGKPQRGTVAAQVRKPFGLPVTGCTVSITLAAIILVSGVLFARQYVQFGSEAHIDMVVGDTAMGQPGFTTETPDGWVEAKSDDVFIVQKRQSTRLWDVSQPSGRQEEPGSDIRRGDPRASRGGDPRVSTGGGGAESIDEPVPSPVPSTASKLEVTIAFQRMNLNNPVTSIPLELSYCDSSLVGEPMPLIQPVVVAVNGVVPSIELELGNESRTANCGFALCFVEVDLVREHLADGLNQIAIRAWGRLADFELEVVLGEIPAP